MSRKSVQLFFLLLVISAISTRSEAQIELSSGIDVNNPFLINKYNSQVYYKQTDFGLHLGISYKPTQTQFFPTLNFGFGLYKLPIQHFESNVAVLNMNYLNLILNGNFVVPFANGNALYVIGGIGFTKMKQTRLDVEGKNSGIDKITLDSTANLTKLFPTIGLGLEYVYGESANRNIYLSVGLYAQYIYLLDESNSYYMTVQDAQHNFLDLNGSLTGRLIVPNFYISLHYLLGKNIIFWKKKDDRYM